MNKEKFTQYLNLASSAFVFIITAAFFLGGEWNDWREVKSRVLVPKGDDASEQMQAVKDSLGNQIRNVKDSIGNEVQAVTRLSKNNESTINNLGENGCNWMPSVSRHALENIQQCPDGYYAKGLGFNHQSGADYAYEMSYRLYCCSLK
ncbi:MAG: hypothetical protein MI794_19510 [Pseudomonadales bacterium]|nr:hypothetical protein [Pseudomonadales bacterium]